MLKIIVAMDEQGAIGLNQQLPWHLPLDLKWFREHTWGQPILVGRKTLESFPGGRLLPHRQHYLASRKPPKVEGCHWVQELEGWLQSHAALPETFWVVGGGSIYEAALPWTHELLITHVQTRLPQADVFFPPWEPSDWVQSFEQAVGADAHHPLPFVWRRYVRKSPRQLPAQS